MSCAYRDKIRNIIRHSDSDAIAGKVVRYIDLLYAEKQRNSSITAIKSKDIIFEKLVRPCLMLAEELGPGKGIDIGSGNGIPGIVLACVRSDIEMTLLESSVKRIAFLSKLKHDLDLDNVNLLQGRAEEMAHEREFRESFNFSVCRALARIEIAMELSAGFLKTGALMYIASNLLDNKIKDIIANDLLCLSLELEDKDRLPATGFKVLKKKRQTALEYPRKWKKIKKKQLLI